MDLWRKIGVSIIFGIAAIIGGGLFWILSEDWAVVFTYLAIVGFFLLAFLFNPEQIVNEIDVEEEASED
jgi:membrane-associated PAP2 superfamily phosphatase